MFYAQITYSAVNGPAAVTVVDVSVDNQPDIVVTNFASSNVGVLLSAGNGTFLPQSTYSAGYHATFSAVVRCEQ